MKKEETQGKKREGPGLHFSTVTRESKVPLRIETFLVAQERFLLQGEEGAGSWGIFKARGPADNESLIQYPPQTPIKWSHHFCKSSIMKFGNNHVVLELFGIWVRQETPHEANSLYRCAQHVTELQLLVVWELRPQAQWATGQLLQEALSMHWDTASRYSVSREASHRKPGWETMGQVKGCYGHDIGSRVRTGKNPFPDLWSLCLIALHWSLSITENTGLKGVPSQGFAVFQKEKSF